AASRSERRLPGAPERRQLLPTARVAAARARTATGATATRPRRSRRRRRMEPRPAPAARTPARPGRVHAHHLRPRVHRGVARNARSAGRSAPDGADAPGDGAPDEDAARAGAADADAADADAS